MKIDYSQPRKILILGASSGIGLALAQQLTAKGHHVAVAARREEQLQTMGLPYRIIDVTKTDLLPALLQSLVDELQGMDLFILASGCGNTNRALEPSIELATNAVNVMGFTAAADWAYTYFKEQKRGHLVAITSITGLRGIADAPSYSASKAYQIHYLDALRTMAAKGTASIVVTDICPGFVDTAMGQGERAFWVAPTEKAARQIIKAIYGARKQAYVTKRWRLVAWLIRLLPDWVYNKI